MRGVHLTGSRVFSPVSQHMGWCGPYSGWIFDLIKPNLGTPQTCLKASFHSDSRSYQPDNLDCLQGFLFYYMYFVVPITMRMAVLGGQTLQY